MQNLRGIIEANIKENNSRCLLRTKFYCENTTNISIQKLYISYEKQLNEHITFARQLKLQVSAQVRTLLSRFHTHWALPADFTLLLTSSRLFLI